MAWAAWGDLLVAGDHDLRHAGRAVGFLFVGRLELARALEHDVDTVLALGHFSPCGSDHAGQFATMADA